jgi:hypothetical protein
MEVTDWLQGNELQQLCSTPVGKWCSFVLGPVIQCEWAAGLQGWLRQASMMEWGGARMRVMVSGHGDRVARVQQPNLVKCGA